VVGRIIKVDHVGDYKRKLEEDEEEKQKKREERGVCYAFQRGECKRGDACKFSHDEQVWVNLNRLLFCLQMVRCLISRKLRAIMALFSLYS
jgi:hypothetical protein